jgi:predicted SAM-dependent methyltransferase
VSDPVKLNLGCRSDIRPGFVNIDIQEFPGVDQVLDAVTMTGYADNSIDFIVAQHLLQFIPRAKTVTALQNWLRILKPGAPLEIRVTDLAVVTRSLYLNNISQEMGLHHEMVISFLYGKQRDQHDICQNGFTSDFLQGILVGVGYQINNVVTEEYDVILTAVKPKK